MVRRTTIGKIPREHFMLAMDEEFAKFECQELALQNADRNERAERLRLPVTKDKEKSGLRA
jgi:hypothetical protein